MYKLFFLSILSFCLACGTASRNSNQNDKYKNDFTSILNNYDLKGSILIYDPQEQEYYSNDFEWADRGFLPASTFKIPNSIIALESSVLRSDTSILKWDGQKRDFENWEKDLTLREAFQTSCVPCFQEIARKIGVANMKTYLNKLHYNGMDVRTENMDSFWLKGNSQISCFEQIDFLERFISKKLPILNTTRETMLRVFLIEEGKNYKLSGKTGWSYNEIDNNGWFVGFLEKDEKKYYFALNATPKDPKRMEKFAEGRKQAVYDALKTMKLM
ncbi:class D beta-lactamase [Sphingobacterium paucimobilis]|uniref:Beta-lactamase n=1 Tax=Sphingobacterium paucimobilis HER1398 TaxID=1346330 RepID=U2HH38_9SPHI|nr:class D beta-lactamase [Sphingobacterium paucimobilis]ERJ61046.1 hypothetical protein M472_20055 [Sphingobacterium paucimobilis HER1398]